MKILIGYEMSGIEREAFKTMGWDAWSCDLKETLQPGQHLRCDIKEVLYYPWDMAIFHPDCTYTCYSGERWMVGNKERMMKRHYALNWLRQLWELPIKHIAIEQSYSTFLINHWKKPTQTIHPYHFGQPYKKSICLYLKNLPPLFPTQILPQGHRYPIAYMMPGSRKQSEKRSLSFRNIASAMADQWTKYYHQQQLANFAAVPG